MSKILRLFFRLAWFGCEALFRKPPGVRKNAHPIRFGYEDQIYDLLQEFSLVECEYRPVSQLSRGQRFKAALTAMIALDRELWLIDEPFASGMDPQGMKAFKKHARESTSRGNTVIYTTQILEIAETFADQVIVLNRGKLVAFGTLDEIKNSSHGEKSLQGFFDQL